MSSNVPNYARFAGKRTLVTGAASGIGQAAAQALRAEGAIVGAVDLKETNEGDFNYQLNVSDSNAVQMAIEDFVQKVGGLDVLILAAGINGPIGRIDDIAPEEIRHLFEVNVMSVFNFAHYAIRHLEKTEGNIVLVGSINGSRSFGWAGASPYVASKAAVMALGRNFSTEFGPRKVRINTVCPGSTSTAIWESTKFRGKWPIGVPVHYPEGQMPLKGNENATPAQVADAILFLASDAASHVTGTEIFIDAGQSLV